MTTAIDKSKTKRRRKNSNRDDIYTRVTNAIIRQLEEGIRPWLKPWNAELAAGRITRPLRHNGEPYHGINILMLWAAAEEAGFSCPIWLTYQQAKQLGGQVKKGQTGFSVVYASTFKKRVDDESSEESEREIPFLKQYTVFNAEQCDGLPDHFYQLKQRPNEYEYIEPVKQAEAFLKRTDAEIRIGGNRACYVQAGDFIRMPAIETFCNSESHAATLSHELIHWTKHPKRLDRNLGRKTWGDEGYAMEELVAEIGAAFLCADLAISPEIRTDHANYIGSWLNVLRNDKQAVFTAASMASKAVDYLHQLQR